jgi:anti-anti-sigma factor
MLPSRIVRAPAPGAAGRSAGRLHCSGCAAHFGGAADAADAAQLPCPLSLPAPTERNPPAPAERLHAVSALLVVDVQRVEADRDDVHRVDADRGAGHFLVTLGGDLEMSTACKLHFRLRGLIAERPRIVIDVTRLDFTDPVGIGILRGAAAAAGGAGGWLRLAGENPRLERVLKIARAHSLLPVYANEGRDV